MMATAHGRAQSKIGDLADLIVTEVVGLGALLAQNVAPPKLIQAANKGVLVRLAGAGQQVRAKAASNRRRQADEIVRRSGQLRQAGIDHGPYLGAGLPALL